MVAVDTVVKFGAKAFSLPYEYLDTEEEASDVERYGRIVDRADLSPIFPVCRLLFFDLNCIFQ